MATWLTHLRVAKLICEKITIVNVPLFYVGSIAPDSNNSPFITHLCINDDKSTCNIDAFYEKYVKNKQYDTDIDFYIGYYVHLFTDVYWQKQMIIPLIRQNKDIKEFKCKWKDVDQYFLHKNKEYCPIEMLKTATGIEKKWFDYCNIDTVKSLVGYIIHLSSEHTTIDSDYINETKTIINEAESFIYECASAFIDTYN